MPPSWSRASSARSPTCTGRAWCTEVSFGGDLATTGLTLNDRADLKPENLLFATEDEDSPLLVADFGLSKIVDESTYSTLSTTCGTPAYMAPEIFKREGYGKPVDMWALGVVAFFLLCGECSSISSTRPDELSAQLCFVHAEEISIDLSDSVQATPHSTVTRKRRKLRLFAVLSLASHPRSTGKTSATTVSPLLSIPLSLSTAELRIDPFRRRNQHGTSSIVA